MYAPFSSPATLSGFPSACLEIVPNMGFRWLCGEPVPSEVLQLLETSQVPDPIVDTVTDVGPYSPADGSGPWRSAEGEVVHSEDAGVLVLETAGYGIIPWVAGLAMAALLSRALS